MLVGAPSNNGSSGTRYVFEYVANDLLVFQPISKANSDDHAGFIYSVKRSSPVQALYVNPGNHLWRSSCGSTAAIDTITERQVHLTEHLCILPPLL